MGLKASAEGFKCKQSKFICKSKKSEPNNEVYALDLRQGSGSIVRQCVVVNIKVGHSRTGHSPPNGKRWSKYIYGFKLKSNTWST